MTEWPRSSRGDGIGLEVTSSIVRGVVLDRRVAGRLKVAAEVGVASMRDDQSVLDALVRLRAELGKAAFPTRVAFFPPGATMHRIDVTGRSGPELNGLRGSLETDLGISSTVLIDDGARRWLMAVRWDDAAVRRLEELVERAGFVDVAVDPSPVALCRVMPAGASNVRRDAATDEAFDVIVRGTPVVACAIESIGRQPPGLSIGGTEVSVATFDDLDDPAEIVSQVQRVIEADIAAHRTDDGFELRLADIEYPRFPAHDIRAPERQCVALGAAVGAAGLSGRIRPIDMMLPPVTVGDSIERPWAIERMSTLTPRADPRPVSPTKRLVGRVIPRRRR